MEFLSQEEIEILLGIDSKRSKKLSHEEIGLFSFLNSCKRWGREEVDYLKDELEKLERNENNCVKKIVQDILENDSYIKSIYPFERDIEYYSFTGRDYMTVEKMRKVLKVILKKLEKNEHISIDQIYKELKMGNIGSMIILKK